MPTKTFDCRTWTTIRMAPDGHFDTPNIIGVSLAEWSIFLGQATNFQGPLPPDPSTRITSIDGNSTLLLPYASNALSDSESGTLTATITLNGLPYWTGNTQSVAGDTASPYYELVQSVTVTTPDYLVFYFSSAPENTKTDGNYYDLYIKLRMTLDEEMYTGGFETGDVDDSLLTLVGGLRGGPSGLPAPIVDPLIPFSPTEDYFSTQWLTRGTPVPTFRGALLRNRVTLSAADSTSPNGAIVAYYWRLFQGDADYFSVFNYNTAVPVGATYYWDYTAQGVTLNYILPEVSGFCGVDLWVVDDKGFIAHTFALIEMGRGSFSLVATRSGALITANPEEASVQTYLTYRGSAQTQPRALIEGADMPSIAEDAQARVVLMARSDVSGYLTYASTDEARTFEVVP